MVKTQLQEEDLLRPKDYSILSTFWKR